MNTFEITKEIEGDYGKAIKEMNYAYGVNRSPLRWYEKPTFIKICDLQTEKNSVE